LRERTRPQTRKPHLKYTHRRIIELHRPTKSLVNGDEDWFEKHTNIGTLSLVKGRKLMLGYGHLGG